MDFVAQIANVYFGKQGGVNTKQKQIGWKTYGSYWEPFNPDFENQIHKYEMEYLRRKQAQLDLTKEWYSFSEDERKTIGEEYFPKIETPEGGWTEEAVSALIKKSERSKSLVRQGNYRSIDGKQFDDETASYELIRSQSEVAPEFKAFVGISEDRGTPNDFLTQQIKTFNNEERIRLEKFIKMGSKDPYTELSKLSGSARYAPFVLQEREMYAGRNPDLDRIVTDLKRRENEQRMSETPTAIAKAKETALSAKIDQKTFSSADRSQFKRPKQNQLKNSLRVGGLDATQEEIQPVNIPT